MNSDVPKPEKVLQSADEITLQDLNSAAGSPNSYYQLILEKCRRRALLRVSNPGRPLSASGRPEPPSDNEQ